ncbi:unnamed protein product [Ectocarpus sp. 12 AP-2014]
MHSSSIGFFLGCFVGFDFFLHSCDKRTHPTAWIRASISRASGRSQEQKRCTNQIFCDRFDRERGRREAGSMLAAFLCSFLWRFPFFCLLSRVHGIFGAAAGTGLLQMACRKSPLLVFANVRAHPSSFRFCSLPSSEFYCACFTALCFI